MTRFKARLSLTQQLISAQVAGYVRGAAMSSEPQPALEGNHLDITITDGTVYLTAGFSMSPAKAAAALKSMGKAFKERATHATCALAKAAGYVSTAVLAGSCTHQGDVAPIAASLGQLLKLLGVA